MEIEMNDAWPDISDEWYVHQLQPEHVQKIHQQQQKHQVWRYPPMEHLSNDHKNRPVRTRIVTSYVMKQGISFWIDRKLMETETATWSRFLNEMREKKNQNSKTMKITVRDASRKVNHLSKVIWDRKLW